MAGLWVLTRCGQNELGLVVESVLTASEKKMTFSHTFLLHLLYCFFLPSGPDRDVDSAGRFIQDMFMERNLNKSKMIYPHFTTATDTSNIKVSLSV